MKTQKPKQSRSAVIVTANIKIPFYKRLFSSVFPVSVYIKMANTHPSVTKVFVESELVTQEAEWEVVNRA